MILNDLDVEFHWQNGCVRAAKPQVGQHASCLGAAQSIRAGRGPSEHP